MHDTYQGPSMGTLFFGLRIMLYGWLRVVPLVSMFHLDLSARLLW